MYSQGKSQASKRDKFHLSRLVIGAVKLPLDLFSVVVIALSCRGNLPSLNFDILEFPRILRTSAVDNVQSLLSTHFDIKISVL